MATTDNMYSEKEGTQINANTYAAFWHLIEAYLKSYSKSYNVEFDQHFTTVFSIYVVRRNIKMKYHSIHKSSVPRIRRT